MKNGTYSYRPTYKQGITMPGRIECYIHSIEGKENKGACLVEILCETEIGAKKEIFKKFCKEVSYIAFISQSNCWRDIRELCPSIAETKNKVEEKIGEKLKINKIVILNLDDNTMSLKS
jgi:translation elongation factor EF-Ts